MNLNLILDKLSHRGISVESSEVTEEIRLPSIEVSRVVVPVESVIIKLTANHHTCSEHILSIVAETYTELGFEIESKSTVSIPCPMPIPDCVRRQIIIWKRQKRFLIVILRESEFLSVTPFSLSV